MVTAIAKNIIDNKPFLIQVAKDEVWENTWSIDLSKKIPSRETIIEYLSQSHFKNIAVEALFVDGNNNVFVLGLLFNYHLLAKTSLKFLQVFIEEASKFKSFTSFIQSLDKQLIGRNYLLQGDPDLIRIGVVNHWFSVGPCLLWEKGEPKEIALGKLEEKLQLKPDVVETTLNYQGMSFIFNYEEKTPGLCHWVKSPCSKKVDGIWKLDKKMILRFLKDWQEFKIE